MISPFQLLVTLLLPALAAAQTYSIAEYLSNVPGNKGYTLSRAAAAAASNPQWGTGGTKTLFVPADAANGPNTGTAGSIFVNDRAIDHTTAPYQNIWDASGRVIINYSNYCTGCQNLTGIHIRDGGVTALVIDSYVATNGYVYVMDKAFATQSNLTTTLARYGYSGFAQFLNTYNLTSRLAAMGNVTILAPSNTAMSAAASTLNGLTDAQKEAVVQNHIIPNRHVYSTVLSNNNPITNLLGRSLEFVVAQSSNASEIQVTVNGRNFVTPADNFFTNGVVHFIDGVIIPSPLPTAGVSWPSGTPSPTPSNGASNGKVDGRSVGLVTMFVGFVAQFF